MKIPTFLSIWRSSTPLVCVLWLISNTRQVSWRVLLVKVEKGEMNFLECTASWACLLTFGDGKWNGGFERIGKSSPSTVYYFSGSFRERIRRERESGIWGLRVSWGRLSEWGKFLRLGEQKKRKWSLSARSGVKVGAWRKAAAVKGRWTKFRTLSSPLRYIFTSIRHLILGLQLISRLWS